VAASLAASRVIRGAVFEVSPTDPIVSAGTIVIVLIAIAATYFPARGAARIDAARTLRME
jgi:ABC-type lipoprotein release transport system permease subunit